MLSIIIPALNEENYIFDCLKSILKLDGLSNFSYEVIVIDNGSTDRTKDVVKEKFPNVKVVSELRKGVTIARNRGGFEAAGEILVFFDADVMAPWDWLKRASNILNNNSEIVAISGPYVYDGLNFFQCLLVKFFYYFFANAGEILFSDLLKKGGIMQGGNIAVRADVFKRVGGFDETVSFWGDETMLARKLIKFGKIKFLQSLWVKSSARRLKKEGLIRTGCRGIMNCAWPIFFGRPFTKNYNDIREDVINKKH